MRPLPAHRCSTRSRKRSSARPRSSHANRTVCCSADWRNARAAHEDHWPTGEADPGRESQAERLRRLACARRYRLRLRVAQPPHCLPEGDFSRAGRAGPHHCHGSAVRAPALTRSARKPIRLTPCNFEQFKAIIADVRAQPFNADAQDSADFLEFLGLAGLGQLRPDIAHARGGCGVSKRVASSRFRHKTTTGFAVPLYPRVRPLLERHLHAKARRTTSACSQARRCEESRRRACRAALKLPAIQSAIVPPHVHHAGD